MTCKRPVSTFPRPRAATPRTYTRPLLQEIQARPSQTSPRVSVRTAFALHAATTLVGRARKLHLSFPPLLLLPYRSPLIRPGTGRTNLLIFHSAESFGSHLTWPFSAGRLLYNCTTAHAYVLGRHGLFSCVVGRHGLFSYVLGRHGLFLYVAGRHGFSSYVLGRHGFFLVCSRASLYFLVCSTTSWSFLVCCRASWSFPRMFQGVIVFSRIFYGVMVFSHSSWKRHHSGVPDGILQT
jgi:hypothetical protein